MAAMGGKQGRAKRARRKFDEEFKAGAVRLVLDEGKTIAEVARDLDLTASALAGWVKQARADRDGGKSGLTTEERAELAQLRKELRVVKLEREISGTALASSRSSGREVRVHRRGEGEVWRRDAVQGSASVTSRLLSVLQA